MSQAHSVDVLNAKGKKAGTAELPAELFDVQTNIPLIHQVVVAQLAAARQGTHSTKTRGEVSGGGKKPWRQKGTGRARQGSTRAPQWTGGGVVHGPRPHTYEQRTPKKMVAAALRGALSDRARDGRVYVIDSLAPAKPSTKEALAAISAFGDVATMLVVLDRAEEAAWLSLRNVPAVHLLAVDQLNAYDVLVNEGVLFTQAALDAFVAGPTKGKGVKAVASSTELVDEPVAAPKAGAADDEPKAKSKADDDKPAKAKSKADDAEQAADEEDAK